MPLDLIGLLGETTLASSAAIALVLLLRRPMRAAFGAGAGYGLWALVPIALVAVLLPAPVRPVLSIPAAVKVGAVQAVAVPISASVSCMWLLLSAWAIGGIVMAGLQWWQQRRFLQRLGPLRVHAHGLRVAATSAGLPAVTGVLRPRIVLPFDFLSRYDAQERALVVAHERQHIARGDLACNALVAVLRCLYWFNPLLHGAVRRYRHDQELACDARVLTRHPHARRIYAHAMLKTQLDVVALPVGCHWHNHPIKERIAMLKRPSPRRWQTGVSRALLLALFAGGGYGAWAQQPAMLPADDDGQAASIRNGLAGERLLPAMAQNRQLTRPNQHSSAPALAATTRDQADQSARVELRMPAPVYPKEAANAGITGRVVLVIEVTPQGHPAAVKIETSRPAGVFDATVLKAVRDWTFVPATKNGRRVAGRVRVPVDFDIDPPQAAPQANAKPSVQGPGAGHDSGQHASDGVAAMAEVSSPQAAVQITGTRVLADVAADGTVSHGRLGSGRKATDMERAVMKAMAASRQSPSVGEGQPVAGLVVADISKAVPALQGFMVGR